MSYDMLSGVRVLDFGIITAGASTSAILADLGAEVIKIEGPEYIDPFRIWTGRASGDRWWNASPHYAFTNRNKYSFCVDLKSDKGRELVLDLARQSDVVLENFRVGVMDRLGLGFGSLRAVNPSVIMASISSQGATGPDAGTVSFGSTLEGSCGLSALMGADDGWPSISGHALNYPDQVVSLFASGMILTALVNREGKQDATHLDISQRELGAFMIGEYFAATDEAGGGVIQPASPHVLEGLALSADNRWIAVVVPTDAVASELGWQCGLASPAEWPDVAALVRSLSAEDAISRLTEVGAGAHTARTVAELASADDVTGETMAYARDPVGRTAKGLPWRAGLHPAGIDRPAPDLGADNRYVAETILNLEAGKVDALIADGVLADAPRSRGVSG